MKSFHEWLKEKNENSDNIDHDFLQVVGEARQKLAEMHRVLTRNKDKDPQHLVNYMKEARNSLSEMLMPFNRKPVMGSTEFRMINNSALQFLAVDNRIGQDMLEKMIINGQIDQLIKTIESAEKSLGDWFRSSSARNQENPSMIH